MTRDPSPSAKCVGVPWFREEDYQEARSLMDDDVLPQRWSTWFASACEEEGRMQRLGYRSVRAYIEPVSFSLWCQRRSIERYDRDARLAYASDYAARIVVN